MNTTNPQNEREGLSAKHEKALASLLVQPTYALAAQQCGISVNTLANWLKEPAFAEAYRTARREAVSHAVSRIQRATTKAVETLEGIMDDPEAPTAARVTAARVVLDTAIKTVEIEDLAQRLDALEKAMGDKA